MKTLILIPFLALTSCADLGIGKNEYIQGSVGFYKSASPFDADSTFGVLISRPAPEVVEGTK